MKLEIVDLTPPLTYLTHYPTYPQPLPYTGTASITSALFKFFSSEEYPIFEYSLDGRRLASVHFSPKRKGY